MSRIIRCLFVIVLLCVCAVVLVHPFKWFLPFTTSFFLLLNILIVLSLTCFFLRGVAIVGVISFLIALLYKANSPDNSVMPVAMTAVLAVSFYILSRKGDYFSRKVKVDLGEIEEEKNIKTMELHHGCLENASLKQKMQKYTTLKDLTDRLSSTLSLDKTVSLAVDETLNIINKSDACLLYLVDQQMQRLHLAASKTQGIRKEIKAKQGDVFDNWVFKQRTRLMIQDIKKDFRFNIHDVSKEELRDMQSLIVAPLIIGNKVLGILRLESNESDAYDADDLRLLDIMSDLAAATIQTTMFYQKTQKLAITDGLTNLFVHRHFQERFDQEISRALLTNSHFAFLMIDIDNFKSYNDKYGHIAGDIILRKISKLINESVNPGDIVARYGGEEFSVILVDTPRYEAEKIAENIRANIEHEKFILRREATKVTISAGLSFFPKGAKKKEDLIRIADDALYAAKAKGKNRVCIL